MKLLISGSRNIDEFDLSLYVPSETSVIITGGAIGIDALAEKYAKEHNIDTIIIKPQYNLYGRYAPLKRNEEMVNLADKVLIIWDGSSRGTKYTADFARKLNKLQKVIIKNELVDHF